MIGMNPPEPQTWTEDDVCREFEQIGNRRKVAKIFDIPLREVNRILREAGQRGEVEAGAL